MKKPWRILAMVVENDLPGIVAYHQFRSTPKAARIVQEYDHLIELLRRNPQLARERKDGWRLCAFHSGPYLLYFREFESCWLVAGIFHAARDPDWIQAHLLIRELGQS